MTTPTNIVHGFEVLKTNATDEQKAYASQWIAALRSGEYQQTFDQFRRNDCFCAMGVMYDIAMNQGWSRCYWMNGCLIGYFEGTVAETNAKVGLGEFCLVAKKDETCYSVVELNDDFKLPFPQIADILEAHYGLAA